MQWKRSGNASERHRLKYLLVEAEVAAPFLHVVFLRQAAAVAAAGRVPAIGPSRPPPVQTPPVRSRTAAARRSAAAACEKGTRRGGEVQEGSPDASERNAFTIMSAVFLSACVCLPCFLGRSLFWSVTPAFRPPAWGGPCERDGSVRVGGLPK